MKRFVSLAVALLALSSCNMLQNSNSNPNTPSSGTFAYTAIGASDATGHGSSAECLPFQTPCDGRGYVQDIARMYQADNPKVTFSLQNLGIPAAVLGPTTMQLGLSQGDLIPASFLQGELPFMQSGQNLVTIFAGGNDTNVIGKALLHGAGGSDPLGYIANQANQFGADLNTLISGIRSGSPQARIIIMNLPNLGAAPYASGDSLAEKQGLQAISVSLSAKVNALASQGVIVIDLMCDPNVYNPASFSSDGFHPNDQGYAYWANLVYAAVKAGSAPAPRSSCSQMTVF
jgi:lysophospholipase L1-like esterase